MYVRKKRNAAADRLRRLVSETGRDAGLPVTDTFLLEMADDGVLRLSGCRGIGEYTRERISLETDRGPLTVRGEGLFLRSYSETEAAVDGEIACLEFGRRGNEAR